VVQVAAAPFASAQPPWRSWSMKVKRPSCALPMAFVAAVAAGAACAASQVESTPGMMATGPKDME
jgi:hypothetical protein